MNVLIVGSGGREHAIAKALHRSTDKPLIFCLGSGNNPGIQPLSKEFAIDTITSPHVVSTYAKKWGIEMSIIGPEAPLESGVADALWEIGVPTIGPKKKLAQIETSKSFARKFLQRHHINALPIYKIFDTTDGVDDFIKKLEFNFVIKYDGLLGGKGVLVSGEHFLKPDEALAYCVDFLAKGKTFLIEEKLEGEEFSLMSFCDGDHVAHMPPVQDHKRAFENDTGPNTGGMGSYSSPNHLLPFLTNKDLMDAQKINEATAAALKKEFGEDYKGILYGGFMVTKDGVKLIEYNARFGDPEGMNVLAILESDFSKICCAIVNGTLHEVEIKFSPLGTVCKYAVPQGYPTNPIKGHPIDVSALHDYTEVNYASVNKGDGELFEAGSRTVAVVGIADSIEKAEVIAEEKISLVNGPLFHRRDIGTRPLIRKRIEHMRSLREKMRAIPNGEKESLKLGVLGSTRGTNLQSIIEAIEKGIVKAEVSVVISNVKDAFILERSRNFNIPSFFLPHHRKSREIFESEVARLFHCYRVELVLLIGFMRLLSREFCEMWNGKILNVHPSLLPKYAGGMDTNVHELVIQNKEKETGCTIHFVTDDVDKGPILIQKRCYVHPDDTVESLKARVQSLEGEAWVEALNNMSGKLFTEKMSIIQ